jgi:hypothetical protein
MMLVVPSPNIVEDNDIWLQKTVNKKALIARLMGKRSCMGCEYLYLRNAKYSYFTADTVTTVTRTTAHCALDMNPNLKDKKIDIPNNWQNDNWEPIRDSMCEHFSPLKKGCNPAWVSEDDTDVDVAEETMGFSHAASCAIAKHSLR